MLKFTRQRKQINNVTKLSTLSAFVYMAFLAISFFAILVCLVANTYESKKWLFIIPLGYFVINLVFVGNFKGLDLNVPKFIVQALYFIRLALLPMLYPISGLDKLFEGSISIDGNFTAACLIMVYEYFAVQFVLWIFPYFKKDKLRVSAEKRYNINFCGKIILGISFFVFIIAVFFPELGANFKTILQLAEEDFTIGETVDFELGTIGRIVHTLFVFLVQIIRVLLPAFLMYYVYKRKPEGSYVKFLMLLFCVLQFFFLTSTFAEAIVSSIVLVLFYMNLYPNRVKKSLVLLMAGSVGVICLFFVVRFFARPSDSLYGTESPIAYMATIINAYFTGVDNVSAALNVPNGLKWETIRAELLGAVPFNSTLFGNVGNKFQHYFNSTNLSYGQIPPTIGMGCYYFGIVFAPVLSILSVIASQVFFKAAERNKGTMNFVSMIFCSIVFALGTVMYSYAISLQWFLSWGIFLIIITKLTTNSKKEL